ncbi:MAG: hypothetical protein U1F76_01960 [Candidatus Competibacteraceae bacterium]
MNRFQKTVGQVVFLFLTFTLLMPHRAFAAGELQVVARTDKDKTVSRVYLMQSDQTSSDCRPGKIGESDGFTCDIDIDTLSSIEIYQIIIEGPELKIEPIRIRVYPTMNRPTVINFDLTDKVFLKTFESSSKYYSDWKSVDDKGNNDNFNFLVVTRNYFAKLAGFNVTTAWLLRRWLQRTSVTAEKIPYQAADTLPLDTMTDTFERLTTDDEKEVFKKFIDPVRIASEDRLRYSDWLLFKSALKKSRPDNEKKQAEYCRLYKAFSQLWDATNDAEKKVISQIWAVSDTSLKNPASTTPFGGCNK